MRPLILPPLLFCLLSCLLSCANDASPTEAGQDEVVYQLPLTREQLSIDLLFVIDNARSLDEQASLVANFGRFVSVLENIEGGLPDLHVAVVTTDLGVGGSEIDGCDEAGDGAQMQSANCLEMGPYLVDVSSSSDARETNYKGSLRDAFACMAKVGTTMAVASNSRWSPCGELSTALFWRTRGSCAQMLCFKLLSLAMKMTALSPTQGSSQQIHC